MLRHVLHWKFIRALWLCGRSGRSGVLKRGFQVVWTLARTLLHSEEQTIPTVVEDRLNICRGCPIFCAQLQTCGDAREVESLWCLCYMPVKARIASSVCWLKEPEQFGPEHEHGWAA